MKGITFKLPEGVQIPDGKQEGDTFQAMVTFQIGAKGSVTVQAVDGESLDGKDEPMEPNDAANDDATQPGVAGARSALMGGA